MCIRDRLDGVVALAEGLPSLPKLASIRLDFRDLKYCKSMDYLIDTLALLPKLKWFRISFSKCEGISGATIKSIQSLLATQRSLSRLQLSIKHDNINSKELKQIWEKLRGLSNLKNFQFVFTNNKTRSDDSCISLTTALMSLPLLSSLELNFEKCTKMTSKAFSAINNMLVSQTKLTKLKLYYD
eukprot:TRINITY_DN6554_c0_g1_i5.p1 TRINITY_DN6554_c0_g1~~TRINITY_DN6554_c0_g1_i5.p1  ORF type:complete len:184 (+),score=20.83 TRINITY_DN6554_c0_g1_i5:64-615(+)